MLSFIEPPTACTVPKDQTLITAFLDYGDCKPCIEAQKNLGGILQKYDNVSVDYEPIMYQRSTLGAINKAFVTNKGAVCAEKLGFLDQYTECNFFNAQFHGSLDIDFMKACLGDAGGKSKETQDAFVACVDDEEHVADAKLISNTLGAIEWNPISYWPAFIIDCQYAFVGQNSLEPYLCSLHPELEGCEALLPPVEVSDANALLPLVDANVE